MALEEKVDAILARLDSFATKDDLNSLATKDDLKEFRLSVETRFDGVDGRLDGVDRRLVGVDTRLSQLAVGLDEVKSLAKNGLEAVQILKESTERSFAEADRKHDEQIELLKDVSVHVRKRVERLERTRPRRRG